MVWGGFGKGLDRVHGGFRGAVKNGLEMVQGLGRVKGG